MSLPSSEQPSAGSAGSHHVASRDSTNHVRLGASYEPLIRSEAQAVDEEDISPPRDSDETDVWLTEWQVAEDGFRVELDQQVDWALVPMDQDWLARLFAGRRTVPLQRDTYAGATREPGASDWNHVCGRVARIDQISVRYQPSDTRRNTDWCQRPAVRCSTVCRICRRRAHITVGSLAG